VFPLRVFSLRGFRCVASLRVFAGIDEH